MGTLLCMQSVGCFTQMTLVPAALGVRIPDYGPVLSASERWLRSASGLKAWFTLDSTLFPFLPFKTTFITSDSFPVCILFDVQTWQVFLFLLFHRKHTAQKSEVAQPRSHSYFGESQDTLPSPFFHAQCSSCSARNTGPEPWPHFHVTPAFLTPRSISWLTTRRRDRGITACVLGRCVGLYGSLGFLSICIWSLLAFGRYSEIPRQQASSPLTMNRLVRKGRSICGVCFSLLEGCQQSGRYPGENAGHWKEVKFEARWR